ncbi:hypothetical protein ACU19_00680 [Actinobaculum suis]|uniref:hypothetical protein n=1 Tax=Actinobaculum suis TaxID=1657 RepID=UPI00066FF0AA|nr:hypothetical protein [Actinobaculum suis]KMY24054.1 hypothetical protein ACU19_00680 [Actinobaculum suis]
MLVLFIVFAVIVGVVVVAIGITLSPRRWNPTDWVSESWQAMRADELNLDQYKVEAQDERVASMFEEFPRESEAYISAEAVEDQLDRFRRAEKDVSRKARQRLRGGTERLRDNMQRPQNDQVTADSPGLQNHTKPVQNHTLRPQDHTSPTQNRTALAQNRTVLAQNRTTPHNLPAAKQTVSPASAAIPTPTVSRSGAPNYDFATNMPAVAVPRRPAARPYAERWADGWQAMEARRTRTDSEARTAPVETTTPEPATFNTASNNIYAEAEPAADRPEERPETVAAAIPEAQAAPEIRETEETGIGSEGFEVKWPSLRETAAATETPAPAAVSAVAETAPTVETPAAAETATPAKTPAPVETSAPAEAAAPAETSNPAEASVLAETAELVEEPRPVSSLEDAQREAAMNREDLLAWLDKAEASAWEPSSGKIEFPDRRTA